MIKVLGVAPKVQKMSKSRENHTVRFDVQTKGKHLIHKQKQGAWQSTDQTAY